MNKTTTVWCAFLAAFGSTSMAFAHGGHGGGGGHMSMGHSSFHSSSFHSSPSFNSSSFHSAPSFHSMPSSSVHSSSFSPSSFHSSSFGSSVWGGSSHSNSSSFGFPGEHAGLNENGSSSGSSSRNDPSQHHGFLFFGHHSHTTMPFESGSQQNASANTTSGIGSAPSLNGVQNVSAFPVTSQHHGGFLFFGHHHNNQMENPNYSLGSTGSSHHHHYGNYSNFNSSIYSSQLPPSGMVINMAAPPVVQPVPINLSVAKYFYQSAPRTYYNPSRYYNYNNNNNNYFGSYGSGYGGYGYSPTGGMSSLLFRLLSLLGLGPSYYGYGYSNGAGYTPNAFLGTWGPQSSFAGNDMDQSPNATNFVSNYNNFNYDGGQVTPFANMNPNAATADDGTAQSIYDQNRDLQSQDLQSQNSQDQALQGLSAPSAGSLNDPQNLTAMLGPNAVPYPEFQNSTQSTDSSQQPDGLTPNSGAEQNNQGLSEQFSAPNFAYHNKGVLGSALTHSRKLPQGAYLTPNLLGIVFTHQFWDQQNAPQNGPDAVPDSMTAQN